MIETFITGCRVDAILRTKNFRLSRQRRRPGYWPNALTDWPAPRFGFDSAGTYPKLTAVSKPAAPPLVKVKDLQGPSGQITRWIELNRLEKLNCLNLAMLDAVRHALETAQTDRVILTGSGRTFCTGLDLAEISACGTAKTHLRELAEIYRQLLTTTVPTLVLARGYAVGGGAGLVAGARTAIVSTDFNFRLPGGELASLAAIVVPLCRLRSPSVTPKAGWLGCEFASKAAQQHGLVDHVLTPEEFSEIAQFGTGGSPSPELALAPPRKPAAVRLALRELEQFIAGLDQPEQA